MGLKSSFKDLDNQILAEEQKQGVEKGAFGGCTAVVALVMGDVSLISYSYPLLLAAWYQSLHGNNAPSKAEPVSFKLRYVALSVWRQHLQSCSVVELEVLLPWLNAGPYTTLFRVTISCDCRHGGLALQVLYTAHVGDSGAIIDRSGTAYRLTEDHKPYMKVERQRIQEAGGQLVENGNRVLSNAKEDGRASMLAMSR